MQSSDTGISIGQRLYDLAEQGKLNELKVLLVQASSMDLDFTHVS